MKIRTLVLAGSLAWLGAGCAVPEVAPPPVEEPAAAVVEPPRSSEPELKPVRPAMSDSETLLAYVDLVRKLPAAEYAKEVDVVRKLYAKTRTDVIRMRYAILLSAPSAGPGDEARAMELLDPLGKSADAGLRALAMLLSAQIHEQRKAQGLQQKLDALMSLDKSMLERGR
jgi:hypothetical protein